MFERVKKAVKRLLKGPEKQQRTEPTIITKSKHGINPDLVSFAARRTCELLQQRGYKAYIVGGAVRDLLLGVRPKDFDVATNATPEQVKRCQRRAFIIGRRFRLVHVVFGQEIIECSTFRALDADGVRKDADGRVISDNVFGEMWEDAARRDFTINALYYDPIKEHVIDYVNGVEDIRKKVIHPVIPLDRIFVEDPVRMLRAVKYSATTGCKLPHSLKSKIRKSAHLLSPISPSRLTEELLKIINSGHSYEIVSAALDADLFMYLQPSACALMYADRHFEKKYMLHLKELDSLVKTDPASRLGKRLTYIVYDFISSLTDWQKEISTKSAAGELYTKTWNQCRHFVLPMNPQRTELEFAIKNTLTQLGVGVRIGKKKGSR